MTNVISMEGKRKTVEESILRVRARTCPVVDGDQGYEAVLITLENTTTGQVLEVTSYSKVFLQKKFIDRELNTRLNLAKDIVMFLNHIHFEREYIKRNTDTKKQKNISKIENLQVADFELFLDDYKQGKVGKEMKKSRDTVKQKEQSITKFAYFLVNNYNMRYLRKKDFKIVTKKKKISGKLTEYNAIENPFNIMYPKQKPKTRLENVSFYAVAELIKIASEVNPRFALPIAVGAFAGLRGGETCNVSYFNTYYNYLGRDLLKFEIDLREEQQLRSDGVPVGEIKSHAIAQVHPVFLPFFDIVFRFHENYYRDKIRKKNKFGAMFLNRDGRAMTEKDYNNAFKKLVPILKRRLSESSDLRAIDEAKLMQTYDFQPHTLRYFFSQTISKIPGTTIFDIAMFRRDRSLDAAMLYIRNNPYLIDDKIKEVQESLLGY